MKTPFFKQFSSLLVIVIALHLILVATNVLHGNLSQALLVDGILFVLFALGIIIVVPGLKPGSDTFALRFLGLTTMQILVMMFLLVGIIFGKIDDARYWAFSALIVFGILLAIQSILFVKQVNRKG
jgi:hypothetical protein